MLDVLEVAQRLKVHRMTVYRLIHADRIEAYKVGNSYRISEEAFAAYLEEVRTRGNSSGRAGSAKA